MDNPSELQSHFTQELKRGSAVLAVLLLTQQPAYGYTLVQALQDGGIDVEQNTLYPLLRRLESQGLLESVWDTGESRPRKYYQITRAGRDLREHLNAQWRSLNTAMESLMEGSTRESARERNPGKEVES